MRLWLKRSRNQRSRLLAFGLVFAVLLVATRALAQESITTDEFVDRLERAAAIAADAVERPSSDARHEIDSVLALPVAVRFGDTTQTIESLPFLNRLGQSQEDFRRAEIYLDNAADEVDRAVEAPVISREELSDPLAAAYIGIETSEPNLLERIRLFFSRILSRIVEVFFRFLNGLQSGRVVPLILLVVFVAGIVLVVWRIGSRLGLVAEATQVPLGRIEEGPIDYLHEADRAIAANDLEAAVHYLYGAVLQALAARAIVGDDPSLTAGEVRLAVRRSDSGLYPTVDEASSIFEMVAYGHASPTSEDVQTLREAQAKARAA